MENAEYKNYVKRAEFCPFVTRTAEGSHGLIFRKRPTITSNDDFEFYLENIDGKGSSLYKFINDVTWDIMITGWGGVLVDVPNSQDMSQRDSENNEIYPYVTYYKAEDIINVQTRIIGRKEVISLIVLKECVNVTQNDRFTQVKKERYRVLELDENGYKQSVFDDSFQIVSEVYPKKNGKNLFKIPFHFFTNIQPQIPMFMPVIEVNEAWFRKSADLENGLHWTGIPTPYCLGYIPETRFDENGREIATESIKLGGSQILYFPEGTTDFNYLEFNGAGLNQLQNAMEKDEDRMAILGARIISQERKGVEAAETAKIHRAGENSVIATFSNEMSDIFTNAIIEYLEWSTSKEITKKDFKIELNTDYDVVNMNSSDLQALVSLWQSGGISKRILFNNMKDGEIIPCDLNFEEMEEDINSEKEEELQKSLEINQNEKSEEKTENNE